MKTWSRRSGGIAAVILGQLGAPRRGMAALYVASALASLLLGLIGIAPNVQVVIALIAGGGFLFEVGNLIWATFLQERPLVRALSTCHFAGPLPPVYPYGSCLGGLSGTSTISAIGESASTIRTILSQSASTMSGESR
jgi:hypothetical protein